MNFKIIYAIAAVVLGAGSYFFGATTDGGQNLAVSFDKAKAVYQCAETINENTVVSVPAEPKLLEDAKPVEATPAPAPAADTSTGPTSMLTPMAHDPDPEPAPANVFAENRRTAICTASSTRFLSGLDGGEGDGDPEPDKA